VIENLGALVAVPTIHADQWLGDGNPILLELGVLLHIVESHERVAAGIKKTENVACAASGETVFNRAVINPINSEGGFPTVISLMSPGGVSLRHGQQCPERLLQLLAIGQVFLLLGGPVGIVLAGQIEDFHQIIGGDRGGQGADEKYRYNAENAGREFL